jgi:hypothetical protein
MAAVSDALARCVLAAQVSFRGALRVVNWVARLLYHPDLRLLESGNQLLSCHAPHR